MAAKKEVEKSTAKGAQARRKLRALTARKTYHSCESEFGMMTVDDSVADPLAGDPRPNGRPERRAKG